MTCTQKSDQQVLPFIWIHVLMIATTYTPTSHPSDHPHANVASQQSLLSPFHITSQQLSISASQCCVSVVIATCTPTLCPSNHLQCILMSCPSDHWPQRMAKSLFSNNLITRFSNKSMQICVTLYIETVTPWCGNYSFGNFWTAGLPFLMDSRLGEELFDFFWIIWFKFMSRVHNPEKVARNQWVLWVVWRKAFEP